MSNCVSMLAFADMIKYNKDNNIKTQSYVNGKIEVLIIGKKQLYTKESIRLNKELGIRGLNYKGNHS